jgi:hypothetical protein
MPRKPKPGAEQAALTRKARKHADAALQALVSLLSSPDTRVRLGAATKILEIGHGRPAPAPAQENVIAPIRLLPGDESQ